MFVKQLYAASTLETMYQPAQKLGGESVQVKTILNPLIANTLVISGLVAFFVILFAGFAYISGAGDKAKLTQSTNMLTYGILGLIIVVSAYLITKILGTVIGFKFFN
ncbi:hypothetical protein A2572_00900 [Candidatus Collierbacteria bacterium RIFOXYD1_FULL_40_9]|uniref:Uncharacterized protein n=1 Tax=Candidatus Collierbacteria bacterium RIFOXYD1_FULL_40_9 TaxID=1817731 RepID=A0A1F5FVX1_9BACT|nr:MAG: hypothetical protein A2572_00900 [Candidatus Collierbacteria bacterium RIFOXYD1_FULL_40_9]